MAGTVKRADVKEDKDGKSRGMGTVTFEQPLEAVQAICILTLLYLVSLCELYIAVNFLDCCSKQCLMVRCCLKDPCT